MSEPTKTTTAGATAAEAAATGFFSTVLGKVLKKYLPEGIVDFAVFSLGHWIINREGKWHLDVKNVLGTLRAHAPHLKKDYLDEVRWGQLLDLLNFHLQIGVTDWMGENLGKHQRADMILSLYELVHDDDPTQAKIKLVQLAKTLEQFARLDDAAKLDYAVGRCWIKRSENDYPIRYWNLAKRTWNQADAQLADTLNTTARTIDRNRRRWVANNFGIQAPYYRQLGTIRVTRNAAATTAYILLAIAATITIFIGISRLVHDLHII